MRILIMDGGRGTTGAKVELWREKLGLRPEDEVALLTWQVPAEPLPVVSQLVAGPALHLGREPRVQPVAGHAPRDGSREAGTTGSIAPAGAQGSALEAQVSREEPEVSEEEISEQYAEPDALAVTDSEEPSRPRGDADDRPDQGGRELSELPRHHPQRLAHGVRWRGNKARLHARRGYRQGKARARRAGDLPSRAVRSVLRDRGSGIPNEFALAVSRSRLAAQLFAGADVVVPVDELSQRAAWVLARRVPGPDVVVTFHAAARVISARRDERGDP